jgi:hypothetical protein
MSTIETAHLEVDWPVTLTFLALAAVLGASLGLTVGTHVEPRQGFRRRVLT